VTADGPPDDWESLPTTECHACGTDVPAGAFCAACGAALSTQRWSRIRAYAAAPNQHVALPWVTSSVFPRLPRRSRSAFRLAPIVLVILLVVLALLRWHPPLIGTSTVGLLLLFVIYLRETDAFKDQSVAALMLVAALGIGLGIGWALSTNLIWARTYDDVLGTPMTTAESLINLVAVPICGVLLMLAPVAVVRLWRPGVRESLDGFVFGALAALCFTSAEILTRAAPDLATGLVAKDIPMDALFALAAIRGIAAPLTAAAVGGMVGAVLWFRPRTDPKVARHWYSLTSPAPAVTVALLVYLGQNRIDYAWISYAQIVGLYAAITVLAVLALRIVLHCTLLREEPDDTSPNDVVLCPQCDHVVPDRAYCANCGIAANAASRTSRQARRTDRPTPVDVSPEGP
jgi:hypothetical protein